MNQGWDNTRGKFGGDGTERDSSARRVWSLLRRRFNVSRTRVRSQITITSLAAQATSKAPPHPALTDQRSRSATPPPPPPPPDPAAIRDAALLLVVLRAPAGPPGLQAPAPSGPRHGLPSQPFPQREPLQRRRRRHPLLRRRAASLRHCQRHRGVRRRVPLPRPSSPQPQPPPAAAAPPPLPLPPSSAPPPPVRAPPASAHLPAPPPRGRRRRLPPPRRRHLHRLAAPPPACPRLLPHLPRPLPRRLLPCQLLPLRILRRRAPRRQPQRQALRHLLLAPRVRLLCAFLPDRRRLARAIQPGAREHHHARLPPRRRGRLRGARRRRAAEEWGRGRRGRRRGPGQAHGRRGLRQRGLAHAAEGHEGHVRRRAGGFPREEFHRGSLQWAAKAVRCRVVKRITIHVC